VTGTSSRRRTGKRLQSTTPLVLIVDDDPLIRWWLRQALADRGYATIEVEDGEAALAALADLPSPPAFVLLDYHTPEAEALSLLLQILKRAPDARLILMSAHRHHHRQGIGAGRRAFAILQKPFEIQALIDLLVGRRASRSRR
jgi:DNA-binding NtrC family response regulator